MKKVKDEFVVGKHQIGWVENFFLEKFGDLKLKGGKTLTFKKLPRVMYDREIKLEFGTEEVELGDVLKFLDEAPEEVKDGHANIFYVAGFAVYVYWDASSRKWYVYAWRLDGGQWRAGARVFSRNYPLALNSEKPSDTLDLALRVEKLEMSVKKLMAIVNTEHLIEKI